MSLFLDLTPPRWLDFAETDLTHPQVAPWVDERAAWVALQPDGQPLRHGFTGGWNSYGIRYFSGPESASEHGTPALVDLFSGRPVRVTVPVAGSAAELVVAVGPASSFSAEAA